MNFPSVLKSTQSEPFGFIARGLGLVYLWFGALKFFPGLSPAEALAGSTIEVLTFGLIGPSLGLVLLALWEFAIGTLLITGICRKCALTAALLHIVLTFTPLFFFPELCFTEFPFGLTLVGQYIIKNVVFLGVMVAMYRKLPRS
ncbi:doxx family protein [Robiginitalea sediminis]|uniref:doxx family protein n=1 Tax=Robiginitalea sediminis TaxID=1982593 RepID=UPI001E62408D|nr:doxx family protein [Robiginitalea sediminis]